MLLWKTNILIIIITIAKLIINNNIKYIKHIKNSFKKVKFKRFLDQILTRQRSFRHSILSRKKSKRTIRNENNQKKWPKRRKKHSSNKIRKANIISFPKSIYSEIILLHIIIEKGIFFHGICIKWPTLYLYVKLLAKNDWKGIHICNSGINLSNIVLTWKN